MDFVGVNTVINYDFPNSTTDYIHRVGRTGRAGNSGACVLNREGRSRRAGHSGACILDSGGIRVGGGQVAVDNL